MYAYYGWFKDPTMASYHCIYMLRLNWDSLNMKRQALALELCFLLNRIKNAPLTFLAYYSLMNALFFFFIYVLCVVVWHGQKNPIEFFFNNRFRYLIITCAVSSVWGFPPFLCLLFFTCIIFKLKLFWFSYFIDLCYNIKLFDYAGWRYLFFFYSFDFIVLTTNSALFLCIFGIFSSFFIVIFLLFHFTNILCFRATSIA